MTQNIHIPRRARVLSDGNKTMTTQAKCPEAGSSKMSTRNRASCVGLRPARTRWVDTISQPLDVAVPRAAKRCWVDSHKMPCEQIYNLRSSNVGEVSASV